MYPTHQGLPEGQIQVRSGHSLSPPGAAIAPQELLSNRKIPALLQHLTLHARDRERGQSHHNPSWDPALGPSGSDCNGKHQQGELRGGRSCWMPGEGDSPHKVAQGWGKATVSPHRSNSGVASLGWGRGTTQGQVPLVGDTRALQCDCPQVREEHRAQGLHHLGSQFPQFLPTAPSIPDFTEPGVSPSPQTQSRELDQTSQC